MGEIGKERMTEMVEWVKSHPLFPMCDVDAGMSALPFDNPNHGEIVARIKSAYRKAKQDQPSTNPAYLPNELWKEGVEVHRKDLSEALLSDDESFSVKIRDFWRRKWVTGLVKYGTFDIVSQPGYMWYFLYHILTDLGVIAEYVENARIDKISIPLIGNPFGVFIKDTLLTGSNIHTLYYADKLKTLHPKVIAELGGGIGTLAYMLNRSNDYLYYNFDLPEVLAINQYYLMSAMPFKKFRLYGEDEWDYDMALLPYWCIEELMDDEVDLFINIHSMSEMKPDAVTEYLKQISRATNRYFYMENSVVKQEYNESIVENFDFGGFNRLYKSPSIWGESIYREYLYERA